MIQVIDESLAGGGQDYDFLRRLLVTDWESTECLMRLSEDLRPADLADATLFLDTRIFLAALAEENGAPTTATGNLSRAFVGQMFERLHLPPLTRESIRRCNKVLNEHDLWALHLARIISQCARLIARRKQRFHLTKAGRAMLPDERAGALFRALFSGILPAL